MVNALDKEKGITLEDFKLIKMNMTNCMISFLMSFFNLCHTCIYTPYATALFCSLTFLLLAIAYAYHSFYLLMWCQVLNL